MFIDTHCHLNIMLLSKERDHLMSEAELEACRPYVDAARVVGVNYIINAGTTKIESENSILLAAHFDAVYATIGIHPCDTAVQWQQNLDMLIPYLEEKELHKIVAIGETGLDFYHKPFNVEEQKKAFRAHIELAIEYDLPVVIHIRESADEALKVLEAYKNRVRGVIHCFTQQKYIAEKVFEWGFYVGINAPITYPKNQAFRDLVATLPLERILLETDAPFLPPQQLRGKQNSSATIPIFAKVLAELQNCSLEKVAEITTKNAQTLFKLPE
jgi:TatD DNase family protein